MYINNSYIDSTLHVLNWGKKCNKVNVPYAAMFFYCLGMTYQSYARVRVVARTRQDITIKNKARKNNTRQHKRAPKLAMASHIF